MPGAYKRESDKARGKLGKYTGWYYGVDGKKVEFAGSTSKAETISQAVEREESAAKVRKDRQDPKEIARKAAAAIPIVDHVQAYHDHLVRKGDTAKHAEHIRGVLLRLLKSAGVKIVAEVCQEAAERAMASIPSNRSARTRNHARGALKAFAAWLYETGRIKEEVQGIRLIAVKSQEADRRLRRRAMTDDEVSRLIAAALDGVTFYGMSGVQRAILYRIALGTGFRANELRSLTPERFDLGGRPTITVPAGYTKNRKDAPQPITKALADSLRGWLATCEPGKPVLPIPEKCSRLLYPDLAAAGVPRVVDGKSVDFHSLRVTYITNLARRGVSPQMAMRLARHSNINLTASIYTKFDDDEMRGAIE